jgi:recombination protein RecT
MSTTDQLRNAVTPAKPQEADPKKPRTVLDKIGGPNFMAQLSVALPKAMTPERLVRVVTTECRKTPALLNCNPESFLGAVLQCAHGP